MCTSEVFTSSTDCAIFHMLKVLLVFGLIYIVTVTFVYFLAYTSEKIFKIFSKDKLWYGNIGKGAVALALAFVIMKNTSWGEYITRLFWGEGTETTIFVVGSDNVAFDIYLLDDDYEKELFAKVCPTDTLEIEVKKGAVIEVDMERHKVDRPGSYILNLSNSKFVLLSPANWQPTIFSRNIDSERPPKRTVLVDQRIKNESVFAKSSYEFRVPGQSYEYDSKLAIHGKGFEYLTLFSEKTHFVDRKMSNKNGGLESDIENSYSRLFLRTIQEKDIPDDFTVETKRITKEIRDEAESLRKCIRNAIDYYDKNKTLPQTSEWSVFLFEEDSPQYTEGETLKDEFQQEQSKSPWKELKLFQKPEDSDESAAYRFVNNGGDIACQLKFRHPIPGLIGIFSASAHQNRSGKYLPAVGIEQDRPGG